MSLNATIRFTSLLALLAGAGAITLVVLRLLPSGRQPLERVGPVATWLAWAVAATAMTGSLYFSESKHFEPCKLCWYQRIAMFSLVAVLLVGAIRRDRGARWYAVPLAAAGIIVSIYHYFIEWFPQLESGSCSLSVPCTAYYFREFGFITLSFMAMSGFAAILTLLLLPPHDPLSESES